MARDLASDEAVRVLCRLGSALLASAEDFWGRSAEIGFRYLRSTLGFVAQRPLADDLPGHMLRETRHYLTEMAMVPGLALERLGTELGVGGDAARDAPATYRVEGRSLMLPVRVRDAAQGMALYPVSARAAQGVLDERGVPFRVVDLGRDRTPLAIFALRNREGDLGSPDELGAAFFVAPEADPSAVGMYIVDFPGSERFSCAAGREIWGYAKRESTLDFAWTETEAACSVGSVGDGGPAFTIAFPRGGSGASSAIPFTTYTLRDGRPHRTVFIRSGRGERIRADGDGVRLELGETTASAQDPLGRMLRVLGVPEARPLLHAWTEHVAIEFGPAVPL